MKNTYELKTGIRKKVLVCLMLLSLFLGSILYPLTNNLVKIIGGALPTLAAFIDRWEFLGVVPTQLTSVLIFGVLSWLFNNYIWKMKIFAGFLHVANLNGTWKGGLESDYPNTKPIEMELTIKQTWEEMTCQCSFRASSSCSDIICLDTEGPQGTVLKFTYINDSSDLDTGLVQFSGYNELRLTGENTLAGTYFTKRVPATRGTIFLTRQISDAEINEDLTNTAVSSK